MMAGVIFREKQQHLSITSTQKEMETTVPEVSAADLDNDGDLDIVYSRAGVFM